MGYVNPEMIIIVMLKVNKTMLTIRRFLQYDIRKNNTRFEIGTWDEAECIKIL